MTDLLDLVLEEGASDLHIHTLAPPVLRIHGEMTQLDGPALTPEDSEYLMKAITSEANQQKLQQDGTVDFGFAFGDRCRFRVSVFKARGDIGIVMRTIPNDLLTMAQIGLPNSVKDVLFRPRGLVLITGPTGSGKSTTLASMIDVINVEKKDHIITIEDPIEFYHNHKNSIVTQREVHNESGAKATVLDCRSDRSIRHIDRSEDAARHGDHPLDHAVVKGQELGCIYLLQIRNGVDLSSFDGIIEPAQEIQSSHQAFVDNDWDKLLSDLMQDADLHTQVELHRLQDFAVLVPLCKKCAVEEFRDPCVELDFVDFLFSEARDSRQLFDQRDDRPGYTCPLSRS